MQKQLPPRSGYLWHSFWAYCPKSEKKNLDFLYTEKIRTRNSLTSHANCTGGASQPFKYKIDSARGVSVFDGWHGLRTQRDDIVPHRTVEVEKQLMTSRSRRHKKGYVFDKRMAHGTQASQRLCVVRTRRWLARARPDCSTLARRPELHN